MGGVAPRGLRQGDGMGGAGRLLGVAGCCFGRRGCVGSACYHNPAANGRGWDVQGREKGGAGRCSAGERWSWARPLAL